jgi:SAM-dependent methyltransferase
MPEAPDTRSSMPHEQPDLYALQRRHWQDTYRAHPDMYGSAPSAPAVYAANLFKAAGAKRILELAAGHGRDAVYFARQGFTVLAIDFSDVAIERIRRVAQAQSVAAQVSAIAHDMREPFPLENHAVDAVFAHMALCMALSTNEIHAIVNEVRRVLRPGGIFVYTVRHTGDAHYGAGNAYGDNISSTVASLCTSFPDNWSMLWPRAGPSMTCMPSKKATCLVGYGESPLRNLAEQQHHQNPP